MHIGSGWKGPGQFRNGYNIFDPWRPLIRAGWFLTRLSLWDPAFIPSCFHSPTFASQLPSCTKNGVVFSIHSIPEKKCLLIHTWITAVHSILCIFQLYSSSTLPENMYFLSLCNMKGKAMWDRGEQADGWGETLVDTCFLILHIADKSQFILDTHKHTHTGETVLQ